jgi:23S rRNA (cytosine1962-C5)-methyltransferase
LNLFCYTGSFSVAAGLGGAIRTTSIDSSRAALGRVNDNLRLNALDPAAHRILRADAVEYLSRATRGSERFDIIVLDPPTFSSRSARTFRARSQYETMAIDCFRLLGEGGRLLAVSNDRGTSRKDFRQAVEHAARHAGRKLVALEAPEPPLDCPLGSDPEAATKSLWATVD